MTILQSFKNKMDPERWQTYLVGYAKKPKALIYWLEDLNPKLTRSFLSYASIISDPQLLGMGIKILRLQDEGVEVVLPYRWRNRTRSGEIPTSIVLGLAEYGIRLFWEKQLDILLNKIEVQSVDVHFLKPVYEDILARFFINSEEREEVLFRSKAKGESEVTCQVGIYNKKSIRVAEMNIKIKITTDKVITN